MVGAGVDAAGNCVGIGGISHPLGDELQQIPVVLVGLTLQGEGQVGQHLVGVDLGLVAVGVVGGPELLCLHSQPLVEPANQPGEQHHPGFEAVLLQQICWCISRIRRGPGEGVVDPQNAVVIAAEACGQLQIRLEGLLQAGGNQLAEILSILIRIDGIKPAAGANSIHCAE